MKHPDSSFPEVEIAIVKMKGPKSYFDQLLAELTLARSEVIIIGKGRIAAGLDAIHCCVYLLQKR
jgi:hypothetical protein